MGSVSPPPRPHPFTLNDSSPSCSADRGRLPLQSGGLRGPEREESGLKAEFCVKNFLLEAGPEGVKGALMRNSCTAMQLTGDTPPPRPHSVQFLKTYDLKIAVVWSMPLFLVCGGVFALLLFLMAKFPPPQINKIKLKTKINNNINKMLQ